MFAVHPSANPHREGLLRFGIGYNPLMDELFIAPDAKDNQLLTEQYVVQHTESLAVELLRMPHKKRIFGVKYVGAAAFCANFGCRKLPRPCEAKLFADMADRWLEECAAHADDLLGARRKRARQTHKQARRYAASFGLVPDPVVEAIQAVVEELYLKRAARLH